MKTLTIYLKIFLKDLDYEFLDTNDIKIISEEEAIDSLYEKFPQIINLENIDTSIEFNKFLIDKYRYNNFNINSNGKEISRLRIVNIQNSLVRFLDWLTQNNINWKVELTTTDETPIKLYQKYLIDQIQEGVIQYGTATTYLGDVIMLFEWALSRNLIEALPFEYNIYHYTNHNSNIVTSKRSPSKQIYSAKIRIPKKYKNIKNKFLSAFTTEEYNHFTNTEYCQSQARKIWIKLAKEYGLRRNEIININEDILDENKQGLYDVIGKGNKKRKVYFKEKILKEIKEYSNCKQRKLALQKLYLESGYTTYPPLFLNNEGKRILASSLSNIMYPARAELAAKGIKFNKTFHDLRATYAVERVLELLQKGLDFEDMKFVISDELGHSLFETTKKYLRIKNARETWSEQSGVADMIDITELTNPKYTEDILDDFL